MLAPFAIVAQLFTFCLCLAFYFPNGTTLLQYDWQAKGVKTKGFFLARAPNVTGPYTPVSGEWAPSGSATIDPKTHTMAD
jgi:hypothetical protein